MPLLYWALEDIQQTITATGYIIVTKTDVACHMWLRWTLKPPQKHPKAVTVRGLTKMTDARFCFVAFCDVEQEEEGDTLTHTFILPSEDPPTDPHTSEWPFYEPWGDSLTTYNWWNKYQEPEVPNVSFAPGVITIENPGYEDCGIVHELPTQKVPLSYSPLKPLKIAINNTEATANSTSSQILHELIFMKNGEHFRIYLAISWGAEFDEDEPWTTGVSFGIPYGVLFVGTGEHTINLLDWFTTFRNDLGLSTDPTDWFLETIAFALGTFSPACTDHVKSDYLGCYLPQTSECNLAPWPNCQTRYFYFWATNAGERMVSTSPIFSKHRFYVPPPYTLILLEPWTVTYEPPDFTLVILEPWEIYLLPPFTLILFEPWQVSYGPPDMDSIIFEPWEIDFSPPDFERRIFEPWTN